MEGREGGGGKTGRKFEITKTITYNLIERKK